MDTVQQMEKMHGLNQIVYDFNNFRVTGHSLGGALAVLAASDLKMAGKNILHFYTFGAPRVGDPKFVQWFDAKFGSQFKGRITHSHDPVPHLPP